MALQGGAVTCPAPLPGGAPVPDGNEAPLGDGSNMCPRGTHGAGSTGYACTCAECDVGACGGVSCTHFLFGCAGRALQDSCWCLLTVLPGAGLSRPGTLSHTGAPVPQCLHLQNGDMEAAGIPSSLPVKMRSVPRRAHCL